MSADNPSDGDGSSLPSASPAASASSAVHGFPVVGVVLGLLCAVVLVGLTSIVVLPKRLQHVVARESFRVGGCVDFVGTPTGSNRPTKAVKCSAPHTGVIRREVQFEDECPLGTDWIVSAKADLQKKYCVDQLGTTPVLETRV